MDRTLVALVTDRGFLAPSINACLQLVDQRIPELADIVVYLVDVDPETLQRLRDHFSPRGIQFESLESRSFIPPSRRRFESRHYPVSALARLALTEIFPPRYDNVVYLDGDIQIVGDVRPLITYKAPEGMIAAARDTFWLQIVLDPGHWSPNYIKELGILASREVSADGYFNSGVLAFRRETWREIAPQALDFYFDHPPACRFCDQSALNAVCAGRVVHLSPAYNFQNTYHDIRAHESYAPRIIHFTGPRKPWKDYGPPWNGRFIPQYARLLEAHPFLRDGLEPPRSPNLARLVGSRIGRVSPYLLHPRPTLRRRRLRRLSRELFLNYVSQTQFPF